MAQAMNWYRRAADLGNSNAINNVGFVIDYGLAGGVADPAEALKWYRRSANSATRPA